MFWADKIAKEIINSRRHTPFWVDDMKTPSGFAHVGSLMGPIVHSIIFRALKDQKQDVTFTFVINDFDPVDGLSDELIKTHSQYLGYPLALAPSPDPRYNTMAQLFSSDFINSFRSFGVEAKTLSSWQMYHEGKFDEVIKIALDNSEKIQNIYQRISGSKKKEKGWLPFQVICQKCSKLGTTRVYKWDGKVVKYICEPAMVKWARGCGYDGEISPFGGNGKLPWKVDWGAHWKVIGITIEGAGKDHASAGGSYDIAMALCEEVFKTPPPFKIPYEFVLIGGRKMSSSKGLGIKAHDLVSMLPPELGRFLFSRSGIKEQTNFDPKGTMAIPDLFDEYDRCWIAYNTGGDENLARAFELSQIDTIPEKVPNLFLPRFRDVVNFYQLPNIQLSQKFAQIKGSPLTATEEKILGDRLTDAINWVGNYAPDEYRYQISSKKVGEIHLTDSQWAFLNALALIWVRTQDPEELQSEIFKLIKSSHIDQRDAFKALYSSILDKPHGPRAGWLMKKFPSDVIVNRLTLNKTEKSSAPLQTIEIISRPDLFSLDPKIKEKYPSASVGIAIIKGVQIEKFNQKLADEKKQLLSTFENLTTEELGKFPEIISYRKLYKEMGIDWHSRRPSPEALLRRVVLKKGLYDVNTCVDAYNIVVMKNRVSVGAFDLDQIKFPTTLRYANRGDEILLLGDEQPTKYTEKEIAYYDQIGGYNIDFNFRDAKRTMVTEKTQNLWLNIDGVYDVTPDMVSRSLRESIEIIMKYCGGTLEMEGVIT